jgi:hypothetical protein
MDFKLEAGTGSPSLPANFPTCKFPNLQISQPANSYLLISHFCLSGFCKIIFTPPQ